MDASLIITGAMTLLKPLLEKAGEKAAETIGEKLGEKTVEKDFWKKVKGLFIIENEPQMIAAIESKTIANSQEIAKIEEKVTNEIKTNPQFAAEMQAAFNFSSTNQLIAEQLLISINSDREKLKELYQDRRLAGIETEDQYELVIKKMVRRLEKDEKDFIKLITGK